MLSSHRNGSNKNFKLSRLGTFTLRLSHLVKLISNWQDEGTLFKTLVKHKAKLLYLFTQLMEHVRDMFLLPYTSMVASNFSTWVSVSQNYMRNILNNAGLHGNCRENYSQGLLYSQLLGK